MIGWLLDNRGPLAWVSVGVKFIRACLLLPLLYYFMPEDASLLAWCGFWGLAACQVIAFFLDSILDADGS